MLRYLVTDHFEVADDATCAKSGAVAAALAMVAVVPTKQKNVYM